MNLIHPDAGRVVVRVICDHCGNRAVGVLQEHWEGDRSAWRVGSYIGKLPDEPGTVPGGAPLRRGDEGTAMFVCPRHGTLTADRAELVRAATQGTTRRGPRHIRAVRLA